MTKKDEKENEYLLKRLDRNGYRNARVYIVNPFVVTRNDRKGK